jgi:hypothetical protein
MQRRGWKATFKVSLFLVPKGRVFVLHIVSLPVIPVIRRENMVKKQSTLLFALVLTFLLATAVLSQEAAKSKEARWEGLVARSSKEHSTLTVRKSGENAEKTCEYDSSTKWVSQYHADKKINNIDASDVKDGDYVICKGTEEKAGVIHATVISKRLSHSPN